MVYKKDTHWMILLLRSLDIRRSTHPK